MIIYLYVKQHSITGLKYFGMTRKIDPFSYKGSGLYWRRHIKKYGNDSIKTLEIWGFDDIQICSKFALNFSIENNIVNSIDWANLKIENGLDGGTNSSDFTDEWKKNISKSLKGKPGKSPTAETRIKLSNSLKGKLSGDKNPARKKALLKNQNGIKICKKSDRYINYHQMASDILNSSYPKKGYDEELSKLWRIHKSLVSVRIKETYKRISELHLKIPRKVGFEKIDYKQVLIDIENSSYPKPGYVEELSILWNTHKNNVNRRIKTAKQKWEQEMGIEPTLDFSTRL